MVIYLDQVLLLNGLVDYLLLVACGSVTATPLRRRRILVAALLGGGYGAMSLLPGFRFLGSLFWELIFGAVLCLVAFGPGRGIIRRSVVFLLLAAAFSGIVLVLTELFSAPAALVGSRVYYPVSLGALVLTAGGTFGLMKWGLSRMCHHGGDIAGGNTRPDGKPGGGFYCAAGYGKHPERSHFRLPSTGGGRKYPASAFAGGLSIGRGTGGTIGTAGTVGRPMSRDCDLA